jgi:hypothetical protein
VTGPASPEALEAATLEWLESLRTRSTTAGPTATYGDDLALTVIASAQIDGDRAREGVFLQVGELTVDRLEVGTGADAGRVDLDAEIVFPPDEIDDPSLIAPGRARGEVRLGLGPVYFADDAETGLRLIDYTRGSLRMSSVWCSHPEGEAAGGGLSAAPLAVTSELQGAGRVLLQVTNSLERDVILRVGRAARRRFSRPPAFEAPPKAGLPIRAGGRTHFAALTRRSRLTEVEIFAFDAVDRTPVTELTVPVGLPKGHPGEHGQWCG